MNEVLRSFIGKFVVVYFNDILLYSQDEASYIEHLTQVFQFLRQQVLYAKLEKYKLFTSQVIFLGYVVSEREFKSMSPALKLSIVGPSQLLSPRFVAFMGWTLSIDSLLRILASLWLPLSSE